MKVAFDRDDFSFQVMLRSVGAYLDEQTGSEVRLTQRSGGFMVEYQPESRNLDPEKIYFNYPELHARHAALEEASPRSAGPYQEFLGALGGELDALPVRDLVLDESDGATVIAYTYVDPSAEVSQQREFMLGPQEKHALLKNAFQLEPALAS